MVQRFKMLCVFAVAMQLSLSLFVREQHHFFGNQTLLQSVDLCFKLHIENSAKIFPEKCLIFVVFITSIEFVPVLRKNDFGEQISSAITCNAHSTWH